MTATCKQFTADIDDYLGYWAAETYITDSSIKAVVQNDVNSIASVPSAEDVPITFTLQNPKSFPLDLPPEADAEKNVIVFEHLPKAPVAGRDYTLTQSEDRQSLLLTYKASFLQAHEWGEQDLSSVLTLYATDGRQFKQRYTFTVKANTPPPKPSFTVVKTKGSPAYYVLCIMAPGMDKKVPGGLLHKDLARVEINETSYSFSVNEAQTAFTKPEGDVFITRSEVEKLTEPGADDVPAGGWALYYKTDVEVKDGAVKKEYTVRLADAQGLVSDILNASTKPNKAEAEQVRITKGTVSGSGSGSESDPIIIGTDSSGAELSVSSATANTTVHCTLTEIGSAASTPYNGNPITVPLLLNGAGEKKYKLEYYTDGEGFAATAVKTVYYTIRERYTVTFDADGGTPVPDAQTVLHGGKVADPSASVSKTGFYLDGWYTEDAHTHKWDFNTGTVTRNITLYAKWDPSNGTPYKVEHYQESASSGGTYNLAHTDNLSGTTDANAAVTLRNYPGFEPGTYTPATIASDGSTVVSVHYNRKQITVTFKPNGGKIDGNTSDVTRSGKYGTPLIAPANLDRKGYTFSNWQPTPPAPSLPSTFPAEDATYTAQWTPAGGTPYKVEHYQESASSGGTYNLAHTDNLSGTTDANAAVTLRNYPGFEPGTYTPATIASDGSTVVSVHYNRKQITVTFKPNGGKIDGNTSDVTRSGKYGTPLIAPANLDRKGYTFSSWDPALPSSPTYPDSNKTYTAQWTPNTYYVHFNGNGNTGGGMSDQPFTYGTSQLLSANGFTKKGHTFDGWATSASGSKFYNNQQSVINLTDVQTGTVNLYAVWKIETYTVRFSVADGKGTLKGEYGGQNEIAQNGGGIKTLTNVPYDSTVSFTATADEGWEVESWEVYPGNFASAGGIGAAIATATLTVDGDKTVTVKFKPGELHFNSGGPDAWKRLREEAAKTEGSHTIVINGEITATDDEGNHGEITLGRDLTIMGGSGAVLNANDRSRIFKVENGKTLTLKDITLKNGKTGQFVGGGVYIADGGTLIMQGSSTITNCTAGMGGGVYVNGTFKMEGSALVTNETGRNNEVYLESGKTVTVTGALTHTPAAKIRVADYQKNRVLAVGERAKKENFQLAPVGGNNWRYKKVGNEVKFVTGKLTYTIEKIISIKEHDAATWAEYFWTMKVNGENGENVHSLGRNDAWKPETPTDPDEPRPEYKINSSQKVLFEYTDEKTVGAYFLIQEKDYSGDDIIAKVTKDIKYKNDQLKFEGETISLDQEKSFRLEFHNKDKGEVDVVCRIRWEDE